MVLTSDLRVASAFAPPEYDSGLHFVLGVHGNREADDLLRRRVSPTLGKQLPSEQQTCVRQSWKWVRHAARHGHEQLKPPGDDPNVAMLLLFDAMTC